MLMNLRNALMTGKRLPYDAEVEYLESTGTQYIDTGISGAEHNLIITAGVRINTFSAYVGLFGNYASESANCYRLILTGINNGQAYANCGYVASSSHTITSFSLNAWHTVVLNGAEDRCFCNGVEFTRAIRFNEGTANANTIKIFTSGGAASGTWSKQVSAFKIELNGTLIRDFIPVRKGTVGYLYDRVSGKLFGNAGTGDFVLGPDVVPVEYIESHSTEYIDTGVKVADPSTISISVDSDGVTPFGVIHNNVAAGSWLGVNSRTSATEVAVYSKNFDSRRLFEFSAGRHTFKWDGATGFLIDGVSKSSFTATVGTDAINSISWPLFGRYDFAYSSIGGYGSSRFYGGNIEISGILARKFLPVRVGTEGAMMDVLTRRIYRNAGTGAFTYGNDLKYPIPAS